MWLWHEWRLAASKRSMNKANILWWRLEQHKKEMWRNRTDLAFLLFPYLLRERSENMHAITIYLLKNGQRYALGDYKLTRNDELFLRRIFSPGGKNEMHNDVLILLIAGEQTTKEKNSIILLLDFPPKVSVMPFIAHRSESTKRIFRLSGTKKESSQRTTKKCALRKYPFSPQRIREYFATFRNEVRALMVFFFVPAETTKRMPYKTHSSELFCSSYVLCSPFSIEGLECTERHWL